MQPLFRLALSHKVCSSSAEAKRVAAAQQVCMALVAKTALSRQGVGMLQWLEKPSAIAGSIRAFSGMWDEASQLTRARLMARYIAKGQNVVEVFVLLGSVFQVVNIDGAEKWVALGAVARLAHDSQQHSARSGLECPRQCSVVFIR